MVYKFINDSALLDARTNNKELYIENILPNTVTWDEAFIYFTKVVEEESPIRFGNFFTIVSHTAHNHIDKVKEVCKEIETLDNRVDNTKPADGHMYMGLTAKSESFGPHSDDCEVIFWQCIGQTQWTVNNNIYTLSPGDCIYIPCGTEHDVKSLSPRMGISFGF